MSWSSKARQEVVHMGKRLAVLIKRGVILAPFSSGSSCRMEGLVVTLKIISNDSCDSAPVRTKLSNLNPERLGDESELFVCLREM